MNVYLESLGCAKNRVDSEIMLGRLATNGGCVVDDPSLADVIVVNTCSFIESASQESIDTILELSAFKANGRCRRLIVAGCLPQRYREEIAQALPEVDLFLGTGAFDQIAAAVKGVAGLPQAGREDEVVPKTAGDDTGPNQIAGENSGLNCLLPDPDRIDSEVDPVQRVRAPGPMAYIKIAEGCDRHCTYCVIPKLRGKQKSRSQQAIVAEAKALLAAGTKEIVLVAQETTAYGHDRGDGSALSQLLRELAAIDETVWIRILYMHPATIDDALINTMVACNNICPYFDIPIQHAADGVLRNMARQYRREDLDSLFEKIRRKLPQAALRTTMIVGFPGETDDDFEQLIEFINEAEFDHLGTFMYSDADDLPSHQLPNPVAAAMAQKRYDGLMAAQQVISARTLQKQIGQIQTVLVEEKVESGLYLGRSARQAPEVDGVTYVHADKLVIGQYCQVRITDALEYDLIGDRV